jgi:glycosyltransferase involved in cell wall biosynthesis
MISALILTKNEEKNLPACLSSLNWCDDILVLDSGSTDRTVEIAKSAGARVFHRTFDHELGQRTASLELPFRHSWVYNPDADEVTPTPLRDEMIEAVASKDNEYSAYRVRFKVMFMGRWLRFSSLYPTWVVRLFKPSKLRFERSVNLTYQVDGLEGRLKEHFLHYTFNNGIQHWIDKHNIYSTSEAHEAIKSLRQPSISLFNIFASDSVRRRRALKELSWRIPFRPTARFLYMYFLRGGVFDGAAGASYCRLLAFYEFMIDQKIKELRRRNSGLPI